MTLSLRGLRVLLVEDHPDVADTLTWILEDRGCVVVATCGSNQAALAVLRDWLPIDFVLLDLNLTDGQSFPVAEVLKAKRIPFAFCTGGAFNRQLAQRCGDAARLFKPFRPAELFATMEDCLASRA